MEVLSNIGLEEKRRLLSLLVEKEKVQRREKLNRYRPHNGAWRGAADDGQLAFHKSDRRIRLLCGGNQAGKTTAGAIELIWSLLGIHPHRRCKVPAKGRIIASLGFTEGAAGIIVPKILEWIPEGAIKSMKNNATGVPTDFRLNNGSQFDILSGEQDPKVFEGWVGNFAWIDEPCSHGQFSATRRGLIRNNGLLWFTLTPLSEPWLYSELWEPSISGTRTDIGCFTSDIRDNAESNGGYLPDSAIEEFERDLDDETREARLHGRFKHLQGRIYSEFKPDLHVIDSFPVPHHWNTYDGIDPHLRKEHAYCQWTVCPTSGDIIVCDEIYEKLTIPELAAKIKILRKGKHIAWSVIDNSAETPDALYRETPRRMLQRLGIDTRLARKDDQLYNGIHVMKSLLKPQPCNDGSFRPRFFVMRHCQRHITEFLNYVYDTRDTEYLVKDKPRKIYDDMMDLDRYFVTENKFTSDNVAHHKIRAIARGYFKGGQSGDSTQAY